MCEIAHNLTNSIDKSRDHFQQTLQGFSPMSKQNTFPHQISVRGAIHSALLASALAAGGVLPQATLAEKVDPTLYDQDTEQLLVYLQPKVKPDDLAKRYGLKPVRTLASGINAHVFTTDSVESAHKILPVLWADKTVKAAFNNQRVIRVPGSADPLYPPSGNGGLGQWHLYNDLGWPHIRAEGAWELGATGNKVVVGIVDSGVDPKHPDLSLAADLSFDFVDNNAESAPCMDTQQCSMGYHGTGVAGVAAAIGFNNLGGRGVAYRAQIADLRIPLANSYIGNIGYSQYVDRVVDAIHYSANEVTIKNHSYGDEFDANTVTDDPQSLFSSAENYAIQQTTADGMIHVKGAGNESTDWNRRKAANIPEQIVVTALGVHGRYASYSNYGAGVLVTAPSSDPKWDSNIGIATTTLTNIPFGDTWGYTTSFGGTSAAAPPSYGCVGIG